MAEPVEEKKEVYLEADKEIPGQHYCCLSFISPGKVLAEKNYYFFSEFMKDYEIQYKIRATETFLMAQSAKLQETLARTQDILENLIIKGADVKAEDLSGALADFKNTRGTLTSDVAAGLEAHVKEHIADFRTSKIEEAYDSYMFKNKKKLEDAFFEKNAFRTTVQGIKVRGTYDTYNEAVARAKTLQKLDPSFNVYVGQVGFWLPWDPEPHDIADQEYADDQLNTLMKKYRENEATRDELYAQEKVKRMGHGKVRGMEAGSGGGLGGGAAAATSEAVPSDMFGGGEDLVIKRKKELATASAAASAASASAAAASAAASAPPPTNTITHS